LKREPDLSKKNRALLVLTVSMALGYMPWYNFSAVLKYLADEFQLTASDTGWILAAFQAGYVIVVGATGWLGDRVSLKKIVFWATLITGVFSTFFVWGAQGKASMIALRLITGLAAGAIYVPGMALLSQWFNPKERGGALGAYTGALVAAYAGGYLVAGRLAASYGWRTGILWTSLPAILAALLIWLFVRDAPAAEEASGGANKQSMTGPSQNLTGREGGESEILEAPPGGFKGPALISVSYMGHMWELYAFWGWIGPFLVSAALAVGMPPDEAVKWGGTLAAAIILIGAPATWGWGVVADRKGRTWAIMVAGTLSVGAEFFLGYLYGHSLAILVLVGAWIGFWVIADSAIYKAGLTEMVLPRIRSTSLGIQSVVGFFVTIISPMVFGKILELYNGPVAAAQATVWGPAFLALGLGGTVAPVVAYILRRQKQASLMAGGKK
jgi:MFS family permease